VQFVLLGFHGDPQDVSTKTVQLWGDGKVPAGAIVQVPLGIFSLSAEQYPVVLIRLADEVLNAGELAAQLHPFVRQGEGAWGQIVHSRVDRDNVRTFDLDFDLDFHLWQG